MSAFADFEAAVGRESAAVISGWSWDKFDALTRNMQSVLVPEGDTHDPQPVVLDSHEALVRTLVLGLSEISESADCLRNVSVYVRRFPYANAGIHKGAYLRYHVENYLNELYILQKRLEAYLTVISRQSGFDSQRPQLKALAKSVKGSFKRYFTGAVIARGTHVHQRRYTDVDLDGLRLLETVKGDDAAWDAMYERAYRNARRRKRAWIERTNSKVDQLLDVYFEQLLGLVFDGDGKLRQPGSSAGSG